MSYREHEKVALIDNKYSIYELVQLHRDGRIHFLPVSKEKRSDKTVVSDLIGAIQRGLPMPVIYASELQNGDLLILESESKLLFLLQYITGEFPVFVKKIMHGRHICFFGELDETNPQITSMIMDAAFLFRIIDYHTPKYLHVEVGLFHEKWDLRQEQVFRDALYDEKCVESLKYIRDEVVSIIPKGLIFRAVDPIDEYMVLYMLLFWGVYKDALWVEEDMGEQELLDAAISGLDKDDYVWRMFWEVFQSCTIDHFKPMSVFGGMDLTRKTASDGEIKCRARLLGVFICFYDMAHDRYADDRMADVFSHKVLKDINNKEITLEDINFLLDMGKDLIR